MLGVKLKELRELNGFVQRQIPSELEIDAAFVSKMMNGEKQLSRHHLKKLSTIYKIDENELLILWMTDKIIKALEKEKVRKEALQLVMNKEFING